MSPAVPICCIKNLHSPPISSIHQLLSLLVRTFGIASAMRMSARFFAASAALIAAELLASTVFFALFLPPLATASKSASCSVQTRPQFEELAMLLRLRDLELPNGY